MKIKKRKTSVVGVGLWIVSEESGPIQILGQFREEKYADLFVDAVKENLKSEISENADPEN